MSSPMITLVQTGVANTASIIAAFSRLGARSMFAESAEQISSAEALVLPGVGAFAAGKDALEEQGLKEVLLRRIGENAPTLAVCLGFQLLCEASEESPGVSGLGIIPETVRRFPNTMRVPQLGWNWIEADSTASFLRSGFAYFANSYRIESRLDTSWSSATANYGSQFLAAAEKGNFLGCQFHPELSGEYGGTLLRRWLYSEAKK